MIENFKDRLTAVLATIEHEESIPGFDTHELGYSEAVEDIETFDDLDEEQVSMLMGGMVSLLWSRWSSCLAHGHFLQADGCRIVSVFHRDDQFPREWAKAPTDFEAVLIVLEQTLGLIPNMFDKADGEGSDGA